MPADRIHLSLSSEDVIPTGNEWIALPTIRASDGALENFNVLSMRARGLLQVQGQGGSPVLQPYVELSGKPLKIANLDWMLLDYWIPAATTTVFDIQITLTYCAPPGSRAALIRMTAKNLGAQEAGVVLGMKASWGALSRVTYTPVVRRGERTTSEAPWVSPGEVFSFVTSDTEFAWALIHPGSEAKTVLPPLSESPTVDTRRPVVLAPGREVESDFILAAGVEEFSAAHNARALRELVERNGASAVIDHAGEWYRKKLRSTGRQDLDTLMNRNLIFTAHYAWGRTIDTEELVGVTSRSPRYYVSAAYWDRDAMLWSLPGLLDFDPTLARDALTYALTIQLRNTGTHSRFIDGVVLEDGFQLDEAVAPVIALAQYVRATQDTKFLEAHRSELGFLRERLLSRFDPEIGLFSTLQDSQDEFQKLPYMTYDNVLAWRALVDMGELYSNLDRSLSADSKQRADALRTSILNHCVSANAPGAAGPVFVSATDGKSVLFTDIPPGSLFKLPLLGFVREEDPVFQRTYLWLHSPNYKYSYSDQPYGLPGSYRLPFTTSWTIADHLGLKEGREQALKILLASRWDGGIVTEGVEPSTGVMDSAGRAFATAAGYVAHAICQQFCK
ncbi:MAG: glycoside hydrolase family 125 protein [Acidobacteriales bacterium]|nr:glycoside hydrolase family 125 protein [Terriglobales bacterium]